MPTRIDSDCLKKKAGKSAGLEGHYNPDCYLYKNEKGFYLRSIPGWARRLKDGDIICIDEGITSERVRRYQLELK